MHKLQCVMMCVNQKEFKRIHWCSMREIRPRKMIKEDQKFKKLRARKTKRNMKCKQHWTITPSSGTRIKVKITFKS